MRISIYSNAPFTPTGYGTQTAQLLDRLAADGHDLAVVANYGQQGYIGADEIGGRPVRIFPIGDAMYSNDIAVAHHQFAWQGDPDSWLLTLYDVWPLTDPSWDTVNVASWVPIDHDPVPPDVLKWCGKHPSIAMSRFGQEALRVAGVEAMYAPHAIDLRTWHPTIPEGRPIRERLGIPADAFLVTINAKNQGNHPPRKAFNEMFAALGMLASIYPDLYIYAHTDMIGNRGVDLRPVIKRFGLESRVAFADRYHLAAGTITQAELATIYTASDVILATSMGEGFGLPVLEAMACGTPAIVTDFSAQPEIVGDTGWRVAWQPFYDEAQKSWFAMPLIADICRALDEAYRDRGNAARSGACILRAAEYEADMIFDRHWRPILADLAARKPAPIPIDRPRAERRAAARASRSGHR